MLTSRPSVACAAVCLAAAACGASGGTPDEELAGLVHASKDDGPAIDVARAAADATMLAAAVDTPEHRVTAALGPHTLTARSSVQVLDGATVVEDLTDQVMLDDAGLDFHGKDDNSADYGREIIASGGQLYLRPRYAKWHARAPEDGEAVRLRDELGATLAADFDLLAPAVAVADQGETQAAGRPARRIALALAPAPRPVAHTTTQRTWRETARITAVSGEVVLDGKTGAPLHAHVEGALEFMREGKRYTMKLTVDHDVAAIGTKPAIAPPAPEDTVATPERLREVDERDELLEGMAPPARKQAPGAASGSGSGSGSGTGTGTGTSTGGKP